MAEVGGRYRSLSGAGLGADQAQQVVLAALAEVPGLSVHLVAPGRITVSCAQRPRWAVVACVATFWVAGLGFLFLLVRRTTAGELVVSDGPRGCVVTVPPLVDDATCRRLAEALAAPDPAVLAGPTFAAPGADDLEGRTVARRDLPTAAPAPPPAPAAPALPAPPAVPVAIEDRPWVELRFAEGTVRVEAGRPVVLGRDPSPTAAADGQAVPGDATTVSKSHLLVEFDGTTVTVEDLGSTNGSSALRDGRPTALLPGAPEAVGHGDRLALGTLACTVHRVEVAGR